MHKTGFIGFGHMASSLAKAIVKENNSMALTSRTLSKLENFKKEYGVKVYENNIDLASNAEYIFIGVKPMDVKGVLIEIAPILKQRQDHFVVVSMATGIKLNALKEYLGFDTKIIRIMPNLPVSIGQGVTSFVGNEFVDDDDLKELVQLLDQSGITMELEESQMDIASCISGCSPAYIYLFADGLIQAGMKNGLSYEDAKRMSCQALIGSGSVLLHSEKTADVLASEICTPGGTTIEGVKVLKEKGIENIVVDTVDASYQRTLELANKK